MRALRKTIASIVALALLAALVVGGRWLWIALHVGAGYAAKVTCSLALNSGQSPEEVLRDYVSHEIAPLGQLLRVEISRQGAEASALGLIHVRAAYRRGLGCTLLPVGSSLPVPFADGLDLPRRTPDPSLPWPDGAGGVEGSTAPAVAAAIDRAFREADRVEPSRLRQTKAVVVVHDGKLIAERYAPGYGPAIPMLSWSMAKSVLATLVGRAIADGKLELRQPAPVPEWASTSDPRHPITLDQLLRMSSGLAFDEHYGAINDVSRMLFTQPAAGTFAASSPLEVAPDSRWSYSSGTSNIVARILRQAFGGDLRALVDYANQRIFDPVGMTSAFFEADASGTPIGSSFVFMTARDWARLGELHRRDGVWDGRRIIPEVWVHYVNTPTPAAPDGTYGAHWWLNAGAPGDHSRRMWPGVSTDAYAARGHSGQYVVVVPSAKLVVVRLGLSLRDDGNDGTAELVADLVRALA